MSINLDSINIVFLSNAFLSNIFYNHLKRGIKSKNNNLGTYETNKRSLLCFDDDIFSKIELIHQHMDIKTYKND